MDEEGDKEYGKKTGSQKYHQQKAEHGGRKGEPIWKALKHRYFA